MSLLGLPACVPADAPPAPGDALAPFTLRLPNGAPYGWKPGKAAVLTFCAYWCDTWKTQVPRLRQAQNALKGLPVDFLTVSVDGRWTDLAVGASLSDPGGDWSRRLGIDRVPYTIVVDAGGTVRWTKFGVARTEDLVREGRDAMQPPRAGEVYLTFDDFPSGPKDHELLDLLRSAGVRAVFFVVVSKVPERLDLVRRAAREGHRLEIHAWDHRARDPEADRCRRMLREWVGVEATLVRPPGKTGVSDLAGTPLPNPLANPYDYTRPGAKEIVRRVMSSVKPGSIVQLHVGVQDTLDALPDLLIRLRQSGLEPTRLSGGTGP
ncbi:MAG TPA: polysaccharide deacetylase family protein [Fimbriimonas sp.]